MTDRAELYAELEEIRERGYAVDDEERIRGLRCVAVPVMRDDEVLGGLSVSGPTQRFDHNGFIEELADLLQNTARVIEINAKYQ
nr:IclR family transcriptional regulator C-terminal domain-containing protein [Salinadaptatus halalkaliphilus]